MESQKPYRILLYYKYVHIEDYEAFAAEHLEFCKELGVKGRIIVAEEGINGTLSGTVEQTDAYMAELRKDPRFSDIFFKIDESEEHAFKKIFVRPKKEIVTWRFEEDVNPNEVTGKHLSPKEFYEQLQRDDVIVIDGRNDYEYEIGHFRNAIRPGVKSSREFPEWIRENLSQFKDKKVLTYCTGGIRCEKLSGFLINEGFQDVAQLEGGIVTYGKDPEVQGKLFDGKCYVFDERISVPINRTDEDVIVAKCHHCGKPEDRYVNCANPLCNIQYVCCEECEPKHKRSCSKECEEHELNRYVLEQEALKAEQGQALENAAK
ncbi:rhodanese-related sulfurtransferase [Aneurinibacillus sp. Ricciae_BoGa-3]|uniref:oxygen-dependent tRNA uridine(34) hydroxylase TrhO n=1 Tax=Aneurinibacillus sp. Ricciae_BoGa-3 TaxID=3022697 RepID=UPI0023413AE6|nr:rhodanese-related sulfurtransferase [Aneurinibacillus sp. Ricciae_BoGa-3]WCK54422.1 rhodanese-related sulfurtransferase [Aneurinibacillus sp. Ricciae_BoGa-3]